MLGFFLHEMAFGLLSIFLPLYVTGGAVDGTLVDIGIMTSLATFLAIPFSFLWGYLSDKTRHYKLFILLSFSSLTILLYAFTMTNHILVLTFLFVTIAIAHVAHEPSKNVLIAESCSRPEWEKSFASYELLTELGWLIGLLLGFFMSIQGFNGASILLLCSFLNLAAFLSSAIFVVDPTFIFERGLASMERTLNFAQRGITLALKATEGQILEDKFRGESLSAFCAALVLFSLATSTLFTPLPIFFSKNLTLEPSLVFAIYTMNSGGACIGYLLTRHMAQLKDRSGRGKAKTIALVRGLLTLALTTSILYVSVSTRLMAIVILAAMGFAYALFLASTLSISMELLPEGKAGLFNVLVSLGAAVGCLLGPLIAANFGFLHVFVASSVIFLLSYLAFKIFAQ